MTPDGRPVPLTATEEALLGTLARHAGRLVPRERLVRAARGACGPRNLHDLHVQISRLRGKLEAPGGPGLIRAEEGVGYSLQAAGWPARPAAGRPGEGGALTRC